MTAHSSLQPAGEKRGTSELLACLTLVAPSGLTATDRDEWVRVARMTLTGIPGDLLSQGCQAARLTCRFPSEIVPAIIAEVSDTWERRKRLAGHERAQHANRHAPRLEQAKPDYINPEEAKRILSEFGLKRIGG